VTITIRQTSKKAMKLSYARLRLVEEALRQYFGNKASDWVCSTDDKCSLSRNEVISFFEEVFDQKWAAENCLD
jgi:hypothetical protein